MWADEYGELDECVEDLDYRPRPSGPPGAVLLGLLAEGPVLVAMGAWFLVAG